MPRLDSAKNPKNFLIAFYALTESSELRSWKKLPNWLLVDSQRSFFFSLSAPLVSADCRRRINNRTTAAAATADPPTHKSRWEWVLCKFWPTWQLYSIRTMKIWHRHTPSRQDERESRHQQNEKRQRKKRVEKIREEGKRTSNNCCVFVLANLSVNIPGCFFPPLALSLPSRQSHLLPHQHSLNWVEISILKPLKHVIKKRDMRFAQTKVRLSVGKAEISVSDKCVWDFSRNKFHPNSPTTLRYTKIDVGGYFVTWHSYRPSSCFCTYLICSVQSWIGINGDRSMQNVTLKFN